MKVHAAAHVSNYDGEAERKDYTRASNLSVIRGMQTNAIPALINANAELMAMIQRKLLFRAPRIKWFPVSIASFEKDGGTSIAPTLAF